MKTTSNIAVFSSLLAAAGANAFVARRATNGPSVVQLNIARNDGVPNLARLARRAPGTTTADLTNNLSSSTYLTTVTVGTPPQTLTLQVDTGSSDTWVLSNTAEYCLDGYCYGGAFDANASTSFADVQKNGFSILYADTTGASGDYCTDVLTVGGAEVANLTIGLGLNINQINYGLMGVSFEADESASSPYVNLPVAMVNQGLIPSVAYSLWLNDLDASTGNILFGGVDTTKYVGELVRVNMYPSSNTSSQVREFRVALSSVVAHSPSGEDRLGSTSFPIYALLDSGTSLSYLPADLTAEIYAEAGVETTQYNDSAVPCDFVNTHAWFSFGFGGAGGGVVNVTMQELVVGPLGYRFNASAKGYNGRQACLFGIVASDASSLPYVTLGDTFLRSAYVVYDLDNQQVGLANAALNATAASDVVAFASRSAAIPSATAAPSQDAAQLLAVAVTTTPAAYAAQASFGSATSGAARGPRGPASSSTVVSAGLAALVAVVLSFS